MGSAAEVRIADSFMNKEERLEVLEKALVTSLARQSVLAINLEELIRSSTSVSSSEMAKPALPAKDVPTPIT